MWEDLAKLDERTGNPFPGLRPFDTKESYLFFGREGQSEELLKRLRQSRLLALVGTSGSGKSSLVRAGLVPYLHGGWLPNAGSQWRVAIFRPGENPIRNLAEALYDVIGRASSSEEEAARDLSLLEVRLRRSGLGLIEVVRLARLPEEQNLLVVIDQFEEIFRFVGASGQPGDDAAFVKLILEATRKTEEPIYVALTMRSDFIGDCSQFRDLPEAVAAGLYLIPRMTRDQQRAAIEQPVRVAGGTISRRLVNRLLNDAGDDPDQLPILQHALMRAWDHWKASLREGPIDLEDYNEIGGMAEALSKHADEAYGDLDEKAQDIARRMFQCLTEKGADNREVRRAMRVGAIAEIVGASTSEVISVIEEFRKPGRCFLMPPAGVPLDDDRLIDISHESLIRRWKRLFAWVEEEGEQAKSYRRLAETAVLHEEGRAGLWSDTDLASYHAWSEPTRAWAGRYHPAFEAAKSFLAESRTANEEARRRNKKIWRIGETVAGVAIVILLALTSFAFYSRQTANFEKNKADEVTAFALDAAGTLGKSVAASGSQIEEVMQKANSMALGAVNAHGADAKTVTKTASLSLSFASASAALGNYDQQQKRVEDARKLLEPICGARTGSDPGCLDLLAATIEAEGDNLLLRDRPEQAVGSYRQAVALRKQLASSGTAEPDIISALARSEASLSRAFSAAGKINDALSAVRDCHNEIDKAQSDSKENEAARAGCNLAETVAETNLAIAEQSFVRIRQAIDKARTGFAGFEDLVKEGPKTANYLTYVKQGGELAYEAFRALWWAGQKLEAIKWLEQGETLVAPVARNNPQNEQLADLLSKVLYLEGLAYHEIDRDDKSASALERRSGIANARRDGARSSHWQAVEAESLDAMAARYSVLERDKDALKAAEDMLAVKTSMQGVSAADTVSAYDRTGWMAVKAREGIKAFGYLETSLDRAERDIARLRAEGRDGGEEFQGLDNTALEALVTESWITADMLKTAPAEKRLEILSAIAENASRYARTEPHIIPFRLAQGRSLHQLAIAKELAHDTTGARDAHQAASDAGWRASTITLANLYFAGGPGVPPDLKRASELEALAKTQSDPPTHSVEVLYQSGKKGSEELYFPATKDQMDYEYYRLKRYKAAHVTEAGKGEIEAIYNRAEATNSNLSDTIRALDNKAVTDGKKTVVTDNVARAREQLEAKDFVGAVQTVADASVGLADLDVDHDGSYLMAWHEIARTAIEIQAVAGVSDKPDIVARARSTADTATANIHSVEPEGSTPKLRLAENLEALAGQEVHTSHYDYAVVLYHRAIDLRDEVRANDSKNAECHCHVASDYYEIGMIQQAHGKVDDALVAFERAAMIFEDLAHLSPKQQWDHNLAVTYGDLADLFGEKRKEPLSALLYAQKAADIAKTYAEGQTADLQTRIRYATSLERVSDYAWHSAKATTADDPETADRYFRLAIQKRIEANAKRKSVFTADRKNTGYSALATNARRIVGIYLSWAHPDDARAFVNDNVEAARQATAGLGVEAPEYEGRQYELAVALMQRGYALEEFKNKDHSTILRDLSESANLLRPLVSGLPAAPDTLRSVLLDISFESLLVRKDQQALEAADEGLARFSRNLELMANKAHALMFLGRTDEARQLYRKNIGKEVGDKTWEHYVADGFSQLKAAGRTDPLMETVLKAFAEHAEIPTKS
jgi:hypothetical protein